MAKTEKIMLERRQVVREQDVESNVRLQLLFDDEPVPVLEIKDISPFGICVLTNQIARQQCQVSLCYQSSQQQILVLGTVIYHKADAGQAQHCWHGISFLPNRQQQNLQLFNLLTHH